jgi:hypothetical protein
VGALRAAVRGLDAAEELRLEAVGRVLVEQLVRRAEDGQRGRELVDGDGEVVEQLLPRLGGHIGHGFGSRLRVDHHSSP